MNDTVMIILSSEQVARAQKANDPISVMGAQAVVDWTIQNRPENTRDMTIVTAAYEHTDYGEYGRSVECRKVGPLLKAKVDRIVFASVCADGVSPNVILHGWTTPIEVMSKGMPAVKINNIRHYQLPSFHLRPMSDFFMVK